MSQTGQVSAMKDSVVSGGSDKDNLPEHDDVQPALLPKKRKFLTPGRGVLRTSTLGGIVVVLALISGAVSFLVLTGLTSILPTQEVVIVTLGINLFLVICLIALIGWEIGKLWAARRRGIAGARLQIRIIGIFALIAAVPAVIIAIVAGITLDRGLDRWFSNRVQSIIDSSLNVAQAYFLESANEVRSAIIEMAADLDRVAPLAASDQERFREFVNTQAIIRGLDGAYVIRRDYSIIAKAVLEPNKNFLVPPEDTMEQATEGKLVMVPPNGSNEVSAVLKLKEYEDQYLFVVRQVDEQVAHHLRLTEEHAVEFKRLEARRFGLQTAFGIVYLGVVLILLLAAMWTGLWFANRLVEPIRRLIGAAKMVSEGDLDVQVTVKASEGELSSLANTFNDMTHQLQDQRAELLETNEQIDRRRQFTEAVLAGVTAGVIGLNRDGAINLVNLSAQSILGKSNSELVGRQLADVVPELNDLLDAATRRGNRLMQGQVALHRGSEERTVSVRVTIEAEGERDHRYVVTLDDITELVKAQRTSAWADVARRIAHEIKNPLTPIQLSAERLKRKYGKVIETDREIFEQCTETIIRQVGDIGRMVDEFSSFARMPKAVMKPENVAELLKHAALLTEISHPDIDISINVPDNPIIAQCDRRLISQAVTNLIKNATEAIAGLETQDDKGSWISVDLDETDTMVVISVTDNGCGLPVENRQRLLEPYMTTRNKGTGLGLAIVSKIAEEHHGIISLHDAPQVAAGGHGAVVRLSFPKQRIPDDEGTDDNCGENENRNSDEPVNV